MTDLLLDIINLFLSFLNNLIVIPTLETHFLEILLKPSDRVFGSYLFILGIFLGTFTFIECCFLTMKGKLADDVSIMCVEDDISRGTR